MLSFSGVGQFFFFNSLEKGLENSLAREGSSTFYSTFLHWRSVLTILPAFEPNLSDNLKISDSKLSSIPFRPPPSCVCSVPQIEAARAVLPGKINIVWNIDLCLNAWQLALLKGESEIACTSTYVHSCMEACLPTRTSKPGFVYSATCSSVWVRLKRQIAWIPSRDFFIIFYYFFLHL